jgi:hypothetical protein
VPRTEVEVGELGLLDGFSYRRPEITSNLSESTHTSKGRLLVYLRRRR